MMLEQILGLIMLGLAAVFGIFHMIDNRGGWTLFCAEMKRKVKKEA